MTKWPDSIPQDLQRMLATGAGMPDRQAAAHWWLTIRRWFDRHGIDLRLEGMPDLARAVALADAAHSPPTHQARWMAMRNWLQSNDIPVPDSLKPLH